MTQLKNGKKIQKDISPRKISVWLKGTDKDAGYN
jgi:hypothetical protein